MVNVDLYSAIITKVSNALDTLVSGEKPGFQTLSEGLVVLLSTINILVISNRDSSRVLFDEIAAVYFIRKIYFLSEHWKLPAQGTSTVPVVSAHFRSAFKPFPKQCDVAKPSSAHTWKTTRASSGIYFIS